MNDNVDYLWQRAKIRISDINKEWYDAAPIGRDPLNSTMKNLSENAKLSTLYTNHCIRATVVTQLNEKGFEARDIMATTGHKCEASIRSYATKCPPKKRRQMSDALASNFAKNNAKNPKTAPTSTIEYDTEDKIAERNENSDTPEINFELFPDFEDDELVNVLTQIENENKDLLPVADKQLQIVQQVKEKSPKTPKTVNFNSVANISNRNPMMPHMYFPNSNVTINYNFKQ